MTSTGESTLFAACGCALRDHIARPAARGIGRPGSGQGRGSKLMPARPLHRGAGAAQPEQGGFMFNARFKATTARMAVAAGPRRCARRARRPPVQVLRRLTRWPHTEDWPKDWNAWRAGLDCAKCAEGCSGEDQWRYPTSYYGSTEYRTHARKPAADGYGGLRTRPYPSVGLVAELLNLVAVGGECPACSGRRVELDSPGTEDRAVKIGDSGECGEEVES